MTLDHSWDRAAVVAIVNALKHQPGALMPILRRIQDDLGWVPAETIPLIADELNLSRAEVHGVASFYHDFRHEPPGRNIIRLCRAESCQAMGAVALADHVRRRLDVDFNGTSADGSFSLEAVYCLGNCACSPAAVINGELLGRVTPARFDDAIERLVRDDFRCRDWYLVGFLRRPGAPMSFAEATTVYVPCDSSALSLGAEGVALAIAAEAARRNLNIKLVRNGSRGLYWLEPMIEVATSRGRFAYGPVGVVDVPSLFDADFLAGGDHPLALGLTDEILYLKRQTRLTFARVGVTDPLSLDDYLAYGGYRGLSRAIMMSGAEVVQEVTTSNLRGRGGAAFPAGIKWKTTLDQNSKRKYVVCNADEGDSGTFSDRMIMEGDPFVLIEGMTIAAVAVGASEGYIYLRSEYPHARRTLAAAIEAATRAGYLGANVCGGGKPFSLEVRIGAGAYICGEETAMLESLEGKRGVIRFKPPLPAIAGLFGQPTVVNNVITLASVPAILQSGGASYNEYGAGRSRGTIPLQLAGNIKRPGLFELPFGLSLRELIYDFGGGTASGRPLRAVQVGGPLGAYFPDSMLDLAIDYEAIAGAGGLLGHGGVVVFDDTADLAQMARYAMEFCALESCGKCTPCRIGSTRGVEVIDRIIANRERSNNVELLRDLCDTMTAGSLCALGGLTPLPVLSALKYFPQDFGLPPATR